MIDRLTHHAEILVVDADSYRHRESKLGPEHERLRVKRRPPPMEPYWWPEREVPIQPDTDLVELF